MSLHSLPLDQITLASLEQLVRNKARESRLIDYKREWDLSGDRGKQEFLADVSSFANTDGGELGDERAGEPRLEVTLQETLERARAKDRVVTLPGISPEAGVAGFNLQSYVE